MTRAQLIAKYIVNYMLPIAKNIEKVKPAFVDVGDLADLELAGIMSHRQVRDILQTRVKRAKIWAKENT